MYIRLLTNPPLNMNTYLFIAFLAYAASGICEGVDKTFELVKIESDCVKNGSVKVDNTRSKVILYTDKDAKLAKTQRIWGGSNTNIDSYPYTASLRDGNFHFCGASIIGSHYVLTAAHCIYHSTSESVGRMRVVVGSNNLQNGGDFYVVQEIVYIGNYDPNTLRNDVGFVKVRSAFRFGNNVKAIQIYDSYIGGGRKAKIAGWGGMSNGQGATILQQVELTTISQDDCAKQLNNMGPEFICTKDPPGKGTCGGDSGSSLVLDSKIIGITSFTVGCGQGSPNGFARTSTYISTIRNYMS